MKHYILSALLLLSTLAGAQIPADPGTGVGQWITPELIAEQVPVAHGVAYLPPLRGIELGEYLARLPEDVSVVELLPGAEYNAFRAPTVKVNATLCEAYVASQDAYGFVLDNVEGAHLADCTVQGSNARHDVVISATGQDGVYSAKAQTQLATSSVVKHVRIERLHIEGHYATEGAIYVNMPYLSTTVLDQVMWHGSWGIPLVHAGGQVVVSNPGWMPSDASVSFRTRTATPKVRFIGAPNYVQHIPWLNMARMDGQKDIDLNGVQYIQSNW